MGVDADVDGIWAAALINVPWDKIRAGFDQLVAKGFKWPPSLTEFHDLCLGIEHGVNVARVPSADATRERLEAIEHKISPSAKEKGWEMIREAQRGLK
jgi:hypothetical protein